MSGAQKPKSQLLRELSEMHQRVAGLEKAAHKDQTDKAQRESEEKLRIMFESIRDGITVTDLEGRIIDMNGAALELHGFASREEVIGKNGLELVAEKDRTRAIDNMTKIAKEGTSATVEYTLLDREGRQFEAEWSGALLRDISGKLSGFIGISRDITERKRMLEHLAVVGELTKILGSSLDINEVYSIFAQGIKRLVDFDRMTITLAEGDRLRFYAIASEYDTSIPPEGVDSPLEGSVTEWAIKNKSTVIEKDFLQEKRFPVDYCHLEHGLRSAIRVPLFSKGEVFGTFNLTSSRTDAYGEREQEILEQLAGPLAAAVENSRLFSQVKKHEVELERAYENLMSAQDYMVQSARLRALGEMASGVAHDFNNILAIILGRAQLALKSVADDRAHKSLEIIEQTAVDAAKMVRRLQDFARVRVDRVFEAVDPNELVAGALQMVESRRLELKEIDGVTIEINTDLEAKVPPLAGDASELREALVNIIFNAMDATPDGGKITVRSGQNHDRVVLSISDTGVGIPEEIKGKIFDPFFTTKGRKCSGLGLSVTYGIITRHNGTIEVSSGAGAGTTFHIGLPVAIDIEKEMLPEQIVPISKCAKILVADDDPEVSEVLGLTLQQIGHEVTVVTSGKQAIDTFKENEYDLIITDLGMPDISGRDVARAVKQMKPDTPVLLITGWGVQLDPSKLPEIDGVIAKPFSEKTLSTQVSRLLTVGDP